MRAALFFLGAGLFLPGAALFFAATALKRKKTGLFPKQTGRKIPSPALFSSGPGGFFRTPPGPRLSLPDGGGNGAMRPVNTKAIPIPDEKTSAKLKQLADEIYYSPDACEPEKIYELDHLASPYPYMAADRATMRRCFEEYRSFKRRSKKAQAWSSVRNHAHKIAGLVDIARYPHVD